MNRPSAASRLGTAAVAVATALVLVAVAIVPFLSPAWVSFEQGRSGAPVLTGFSEQQLRTATDAILADLVLGPPAFDVEIGGAAVLTPDERSHMRDVRAVFTGFFVAAAVAAALVGFAFALGARARRQTWRGFRFGAIGLAIGVIVAGGVALFAFDAAFELFHRVFFPGGNWAFDPRTSRLVQLFPFEFWSETTIAAGAVVLALAGLVAWLAGRRLATIDLLAPVEAAAERTAGSLPTAGPEPAK